MSTKEMLIEHLDDLTESQQQSLLLFLLSMTNQNLNAESLAAMQEVEDMERHPEQYKTYTDIDELMKDLLS